MKQRMLALAIAVFVNGAALATMNVAMLDGAERERLGLDVERIVVNGERPAEALAAKNCPGHSTL
jgi:hypothetical protein